MRLAQVRTMLVNYFLIIGDMEQAKALGQRAQAVADTLGDFRIRVMTNIHLGHLNYALGEYRHGREYLLANVSSIADDRAHDFFGLAMPASILARSLVAPSLAELGDFVEAIALGEEAVHLAERFQRLLDRA